MSLETGKIEFFADGHPDEVQLLLALENELAPADAALIDEHLRACWTCRSRRAVMETGFAAFDQYREQRYLPQLESTPVELRDFSARLREIDSAAVKASGLRFRIRHGARSLLHVPTRFRWVTATAAAMAAVIFVTQVLFNPGRLTASELLTRAAAAQNPPAPLSSGSRPKTVHQKVRITSANESVVRDFHWSSGSSIPQSQWEPTSDPQKWSAPLTAEGFSLWRNSVTAKKDDVKRSGGKWTLNTTATNDAIRQAWIVVRASDFHPVEQHIRFANEGRLDFEELEFEVKADPIATGNDAAPVSAAQNTQAKPPETAAAPAINLDETELVLRYTMFTKQWDLEEDLKVTRTVDTVSVSGAASSASRAESMREALGGLPGVRLSIAWPGAGTPVGQLPRVASAPAGVNSAALLKETLDRAFPITEQRHDFVDRCLAASDTVLSHAWALKKLADRYTETEEAALGPSSREKLQEMVRAHLRQLASANAGLDELLQILPQSQPSKTETPANWRAQVLALFTQVQQQDSLVIMLVAGSQRAAQDVPLADVASASAALRSAHEAIQSLSSQ